jgi:hypothetical protein
VTWEEGGVCCAGATVTKTIKKKRIEATCLSTEVLSRRRIADQKYAVLCELRLRIILRASADFNFAEHKARAKKSPDGDVRGFAGQEYA